MVEMFYFLLFYNVLDRSKWSEKNLVWEETEFLKHSNAPIFLGYNNSGFPNSITSSFYWFLLSGSLKSDKYRHAQVH